MRRVVGNDARTAAHAVVLFTDSKFLALADDRFHPNEL